MADSDWQVFDLDRVLGRLQGRDVEYLEFLREPSLSCGIYRLAAGSKDMQGSHDEDEVYYVLQGRARMRVADGEEKAVGPGSVLYIRASTRHAFFEIEEDMTLLVLFANASPGMR